MTESADNLLTSFLADRDTECPGCGYNLRTLVGETCPECGERLQLTVGLAEPKIKLLIFGLIGLAAGAGFSGLLLSFGLIMELSGTPGSAPNRFWITCGVGLVAEASALGLWLWGWSWLRRRPVGVRGVLALTCWGLTFVNLVVFAWFVQ